MKLQEGLRLRREAPGFYRDSTGEAWRLVPVDREYPGKHGPKWFLQKIRAGKAEYQSGVFTTSEPAKLSADYKDALGCKHYLDIAVEGEGEALIFEARKNTSTGATITRAGRTA